MSSLHNIILISFRLFFVLWSLLLPSETFSFLRHSCSKKFYYRSKITSNRLHDTKTRRKENKIIFWRLLSVSQLFKAWKLAPELMNGRELHSCASISNGQETSKYVLKHKSAHKLGANLVRHWWQKCSFCQNFKLNPKGLRHLQLLIDNLETCLHLSKGWNVSSRQLKI